MALSDVSVVTEQEARYRVTHPQDMAELDWVLRYLTDDFERAYRRLHAPESYCVIVTLKEPHHYLLVPTRPGQVLGRIVRFVPDHDGSPVPLELVPQQLTDAYSESDARPATILPFKRKDNSLETTHGSLMTDEKYPSEDPSWSLKARQSRRYKWYHPFGP